jgi:hypothetical protein
MHCTQRERTIIARIGRVRQEKKERKTSEREESFRWILWTREMNIVQESAVFVVLFSEDRGEKSSTFLLSLEEV